MPKPRIYIDDKSWENRKADGTLDRRFKNPYHDCTWRCELPKEGPVGWGDTPQEAYEQWRSKGWSIGGV